jgi:hypothetical protein
MVNEENARLLASFLEPDVPHPAPNAAEDNTVLLSWRQFLRLLTRWDHLIRYTPWLHELEAAMNDSPTAHKMLAIEQPERNILTDLLELLLAADTDIPSSHVDTTRQRFLTLCNQLGTVNLLGMSYPLLAVLNVDDLLKYWHMKYDDDDDSSQASCSQTGS